MIEEEDKKGIEALASIYYEPIWLFYKKDLPLLSVYDLNRKKVAVGEKGSGTLPLAQTLLNVNGAQKALLQFDSPDKSEEKLLRGEIDAMFLVTSPESESIKRLLGDERVKLFTFHRSKAYTKTFSYLSNTVLYEGIVSLEQNLPKQDTLMLSTTASLTVREDLPHELVRIFMKQVKKVHKKASILENKNEFPSQMYVELPMNKEAKRYLEKGNTWLESIFPFWIASNIDRLKLLIIPFLTLLFPLIKGILPLYRWSIRYKIYRWYKDLRLLEEGLMTLSNEEVIKRRKKLLILEKEIVDHTKIPTSYMYGRVL